LALNRSGVLWRPKSRKSGSCSSSLIAPIRAPSRGRYWQL
jgi:hypothetical protein